MTGLDLGFVSHLSGIIGAPEDAMRLVISLAICYLLSIVYRTSIYHRSVHQQHLYFITVGLALCYFNFGNNTIHSLINIAVIYSMLLVLKGTTASVVFAYLFNTTYLVVGYTNTMTGSYGVRWTTAHCVLCLRLTGLTLDLYDGAKKPEKLKPDQKATALRKMPTITEVLAHVYFYGGFFVGPQFSMRRFQDYVSGAFNDPKTGKLRASSKDYSLQRFLMGVLYTVIYQVFHTFVPNDYMISEEFQYETMFLYRFRYILLWGKIQLCKYLGIWLLTEGACVLSGLSYNDQDESDREQWDACGNINIRVYERALKCHEIVDSFNINTNKWMAKYLFKRLRWMNNRFLSQGVTLGYLALWHGIYSGYFMCFLLEFLIINFEKQVQELYVQSPSLQKLWTTSWLRIPLKILRKIYTQFVLSYALVAFCLFTSDKYMAVYRSMYYFEHIFFLSWPVVFILIKPYFFKSKSVIETTVNGVKPSKGISSGDSPSVPVKQD